MERINTATTAEELKKELASVLLECEAARMEYAEKMRILHAKRNALRQAIQRRENGLKGDKKGIAFDMFGKRRKDLTRDELRAYNTEMQRRKRAKKREAIKDGKKQYAKNNY